MGLSHSLCSGLAGRVLRRPRELHPLCDRNDAGVDQTDLFRARGSRETEEVGEQRVAMFARHAFRMELDAVNRECAVAEPLYRRVRRSRVDQEAVGEPFGANGERMIARRVERRGKA